MTFALLLALIMLAGSILGAIFLLYSAYTVFAGAPYVPTKSRYVDLMMGFASIRPGEVVYDLGSGDGKLLLAAASRGAEVHGYEINPFLCFLGKLRLARAHARGTIHFQNCEVADFSRADVILIYLLPPAMERLESKIRSGLKPGARVVVRSFPFPHWQPKEKIGHTFLYTA